MTVVFASTFSVIALQELPDGTGKDVTVKLCSQNCHGIEKIMPERHSKSQWGDSLNSMRDQGAKVTDEEFATIVKYLTMHFGVPVKINKATAKQIDDALILEPGQADAIVKFRDANGPFADFDALMKVPGLDAKLMTEQRANVNYVVGLAVR
jgi:competence ComEA-like helix-hairpin-helix protein